MRIHRCDSRQSNARSAVLVLGFVLTVGRILVLDRAC